MTRVYLGSDHAGYELKAQLLDWLSEQGHDAVDCGPAQYDPDDDYPPYVIAAARSTVGDPGSVGIVLGGSGNGEAIAANKVHGVRAALCWSAETASLAREHNDANVCSLGARLTAPDEATRIVATFLATRFTGDERHVRRLRQVADYEETGALPSPSAG